MPVRTHRAHSQSKTLSTASVILLFQNSNNSNSPPTCRTADNASATLIFKSLWSGRAGPAQSTRRQSKLHLSGLHIASLLVKLNVSSRFRDPCEGHPHQESADVRPPSHPALGHFAKGRDAGDKL